jgi:hypothetical protein
MKRCHICGALNDETRPTCERCQFRLHDERGYLARITPGDVPGPVADRVLGALNETADAGTLRQAAPLVDTARPGRASLAESLLERRGAGFASLADVAATPGLSSGRFSELVVALGVDPQPYEPYFVRGSTQPDHLTFSASRTELDFTYQRLAEGAADEYVITGARCSSCRTAGPSFNEETGAWEVRLEITRLILDGSNANATVNVTMDHSLNPYDFMKPLDGDAPSFLFPARMQLNNNMILKVRPAGGAETLTLVSRETPVQVGAINHWPPYGMRLHSVGTTDYHVLGDPDRSTFAIFWAACPVGHPHPPSSSRMSGTAPRILRLGADQAIRKIYFRVGADLRLRRRRRWRNSRGQLGTAARQHRRGAV